MYVSVQTVCGCHGYLYFESIHCDRCRSLIPYQQTDESLIDPVPTNNIINGVNMKAVHGSKHAADMLVPYRKPRITTGRIRFRALCPFCNSPTYVLRYYCKRERIYRHLRVQNFAENEQSVYKSISETQNMNHHEQYRTKHNRKNSSITESLADSYSLSGSTSHRPSTIVYDQSGIPSTRDIQIDNEKHLLALNDLEGDLFHILRNGLFYDTVIQCQDDVKLHVHRCILGGRSPWFRHLVSEYHDSNANVDYVLQISIDDIQSDVMNEILNFMYTNRCLISLKNAPDLLVAAKRFEIEKLRKQVADFLLARLNVENAIEMLISAHEAGSETLKLACIRIINRNAEKIKRTEKWKIFKTEYVDLVPELYESRIERLPPAPAHFLSDVFSAPVIPSESLRTLSRLYKNPVKQRLASPTVRILPASTKPQESRSPTPIVQMYQQNPSNEPIIQETFASYAQQNDHVQPSMVTRMSPVRNEVTSKTPRRIVPPHARTFPSTVKQKSDVDTYRRPINTHEKSATRSITNQKQQAANTQVPRKTPTSVRQKSPPQVPQKLPHPAQQKPTPVVPQKPPPPIQPKPPPPVQPKSPPPVQQKSPPPPPPTKVSRGVSPRYVIEIRQSPTLTDGASEEHLKFGRFVSVDTLD